VHTADARPKARRLGRDLEERGATQHDTRDWGEGEE
jgi:hypothetical protein